MKCIEKRKLWNLGSASIWKLKDEIDYEELLDITSTICEVNYGIEIKNKEKHLKRLLTENGGRASEVLAFVPIVLNTKFLPVNSKALREFYRFGVFSEHAKKFYTNLRNYLNWYGIDNLEALKEVLPIENNAKFVVAKIKIPYMIVDHLRRHNLLNIAFAENWQSNRRQHKKEYFTNEELKKEDDSDIRSELTEKGSFGLRYTSGWLSGWMNDVLAWQNLCKVRKKNTGTQQETLELVRTLKSMIVKHRGRF